MANLPKYFYFRVHANMTSIEIEDASDVDVVEVVRCKDCKYYKSYKYNKAIDCYLPWCTFSGLYRKADDFCSYGEQRGGELNDSDQTAE